MLVFLGCGDCCSVYCGVGVCVGGGGVVSGGGGSCSGGEGCCRVDSSDYCRRGLLESLLKMQVFA